MEGQTDSAWKRGDIHGIAPFLALCKQAQLPNLCSGISEHRAHLRVLAQRTQLGFCAAQLSCKLFRGPCPPPSPHSATGRRLFTGRKPAPSGGLTTWGKECREGSLGGLPCDETQPRPRAAPGPTPARRCFGAAIGVPSAETPGAGGMGAGAAPPSPGPAPRPGPSPGACC